MTITLHWWIVPILVAVGGFLVGAWTDSGDALDFIPALISLAGVIAALAIVVGHFL